MTKLLILLNLLTWAQISFAKDLGQRSQVFSIKEEGFVEMIKRKLSNLDLQKEEEKMLQIVRDKVSNPSPILTVAPATKDNEFYFDPSYIAKEDVKLPCGKVIVAKGTKVNPLDHMDLDRIIYFIDGRIDQQVEWLKNQLQSDQTQVQKLEPRIVLVGGSPIALNQELNEEIYFDQFGELTTKFGITKSPASLKQDGKLLKINEYRIDN